MMLQILKMTDRHKLKIVSQSASATQQELGAQLRKAKMSPCTTHRYLASPLVDRRPRTCPVFFFSLSLFLSRLLSFHHELVRRLP